MNLSELKSLLACHPGRHFRLSLPDDSAVPVSFHVTEVGRVHKNFLDCGGTLRETTICQLQVWVGEDYDHRIETGKMAGILEKGKSLLSDESVPVEIEKSRRSHPEGAPAWLDDGVPEGLLTKSVQVMRSVED